MEGSGLQANTVILGGGVLVIGQEQDCLGGCFSSSQEFIGKNLTLEIGSRCFKNATHSAYYKSLLLLTKTQNSFKGLRI